MALSEGIKRGTIELLILTLLHDQDMYGYQLSQELANRSRGLYTLQESSMYPTLYRLVEKELITDLKSHLLDYLEDNPDSTLEDLKNHLGSPEKFADEYLLAMDETTRKKALRRTKWIKYSILSGIASIVLIIAVTAIMMLVILSQTRVYYYNEYVTEDIIE